MYSGPVKGLFFERDLMVQNVKSPLTYEDQIERLKDFHKLSIDDRPRSVTVLV